MLTKSAAISKNLVQFLCSQTYVKGPVMKRHIILTCNKLSLSCFHVWDVWKFESYGANGSNGWSLENWIGFDNNVIS
jgi:hypothetical protein